jgi:hypothetical protein
VQQPEQLTLPPDSFALLLDQAANASVQAQADGTLLQEVEFPPVPISKLEDSSLSAYDILSVNLRLAVEFAKRMPMGADGLPRKIALTLPDAAEQARARKYFGDDEPWPGVRLWSLNGGDVAQDDSPLGFLNRSFGSVFKQGSGEVVPADWADMQIIIGASTQELPSIRELYARAPNKLLLCFNLKLDTLRGDLGLPAFPGRAVHEEFLCKVKPVYYMRPRNYSLSLSVPPFLVAYSGVLFRRYPEGWQTLLDKGGSKSFRRVQVANDRPPLGTFKTQLTEALKFDDEQARQSAISNAGFKQSTWWEDDANGRDISKEWKT